jgi:hypothetical protein
MPYIEIDKRPSLDKIVDHMAAKRIIGDGDLNYILFKYCKLYVPKNYNNLKMFIAELTECGEEIRRRFMAPREDSKIIENGDV